MKPNKEAKEDRYMDRILVIEDDRTLRDGIAYALDALFL